MAKIQSLLIDSLKNVAKAVLLLTDNIIFGFNNNAFCYLFNLRSLILRWDTRFWFNRQDGVYVACSNGLSQSFLNKRQALNAYRVSLGRRVDYMLNTYRIADIHFSPGDVVIDCGANVGDLYLALRTKCKDINYIAFEPSPNEFSCLKSNAPRMEIYNEGLWNSDSSLKFYVSSDGADSSFIEPSKYDEIKTIKTSRLDKKIPNQLNIKLSKIEAEGAEPEAIQGAEGILKNIQYITADLGYERGVSQDSTICPVANYLIRKDFELVGITSGRMVALFKNTQIN